MSDEPVEFNNQGESESGDEWENRTLCSDESCIGVIGPDGRCKECGRAYEKDPSEDEERSAEMPDDQPADVTDDKAPAAPDTDDEWENRTLCSDESCIGVIGPDGRCKECGKSYSG